MDALMAERLVSASVVERVDGKEIWMVELKVDMTEPGKAGLLDI
jgi:hypothetical protein